MHDRWTDGQNYDSQDRASIAALCGKNGNYFKNDKLNATEITRQERKSGQSNLT